MKLVVGLGNPGKKYEGTRHNVGFEVVAKLAKDLLAGSPKIKFEGEVADAFIGDQKLILLCPHTYMNASGRSVRKALDFYKVGTADLLVVCDDLNLTTGRLRVRPSGSAGGQKGLSDIIRVLGTEEFPRLRVGIDRPPDGWQVVDYVLGRFNVSDKKTIDVATDRSVAAICDWVTQDINTVMSRHNAAAS